MRGGKYFSITTTAPKGQNRLQVRFDTDDSVWIGTDAGFRTSPDHWVRLTRGQWDFLVLEIEGRRRRDSAA